MTAETTHINKTSEVFPPLPLEAWENTKDTLHLYLQIVGKIKLALMPRKNHWWNITLYLNSRGLETSPIPYQNLTFEIIYDFINHRIIINTNEGKQNAFLLEDGFSVAEFYSILFGSLRELGINVNILAKPYETKSKEPFVTDFHHKSYDKEFATRFWKILSRVDIILKEFSGRFYGKTSPVQLFWHSFDLVVTRFSGKRVPKATTGTTVSGEAYSHEVISFGFWPGDKEFREPAFYSYTYPLPEGLAKEPLKPPGASWIELRRSPMAIYKYEDMRKENIPEQALLDFLESAYQAGAKRAGWDIKDFEVHPLPK